MDRQEFSLFSMALKTYYPRENLLPNNQAMELWFSQLADIPYKIAEASLQKWVSLNKWSPSISEIREMSFTIMKGDLPDWSEGWDEVTHAIRYYGFYRADEALESLSPLARRTAERLGFTNLCMSENPTADRANFRIIFETLVEREKKDLMISDSLKNRIAEIQAKQLLEEKEDFDVESGED